MKKLTALLLIAVITAVVAGCASKPTETSEAAATEAAAVSEAPQETLTEDVKAQLDEALAEYHIAGIVQITQGGGVIYQYVEGDDDNGRPLTIDSSLPIGSVSKQFCAASVMLLCDKNLLTVDDTLDQYFPDYQYGKEMTIRHLLTMSSGIPDYYPIFMSASTLGADEAENIKQIKERLFSEEPEFESGTRYAYSNSNYLLLAEIVEQVSGVSYHDYLRKNFFEPLEMTHTGFVEEITGDHKWTSALSKTELMNETACPGLAKGAGDIVSNAADMDLWMRALSGGKVISSDAYLEMTKDITADGMEDYGYGLSPMPFDGVGHAGRIPPCFSAIDYLNTERDVYLFAASNTPQGSSYIEQIPQTLLNILFDEKESN